MEINNLKIVLEDLVLENAAIKIENGKIKEIHNDFKYSNGIDGKNNILIPGFIDHHMHGGYGIDFYNLDINNIKTLNNSIYSEGVTNYCLGNVATLIPELNKKLIEMVEIIKSDSNINNTLLGIYLEGPFISEHKKGAHNEKFITKPTEENLSQLFKNLDTSILKYIVYAPEEGEEGFIKLAHSNKISLSMGHSNSDFYRAEEDYKKHKISHMTHFNNAMTPYHHRNPGLVNFGLLYKDVLLELISDGVHNDVSVIDLVYQTKGADNISIITDSMNAKGLADGNYKLGSLDVVKKGNTVVLAEDGTLAGSSATYIHCVKTFIKSTNCDLIELNKVTSRNIAEELGISDKIGLIREGYIANCVILNRHNYDVIATIANGEFVYRNGDI